MNIAVYMGSTPGSNSEFVRKAHKLGQWMGENGHTLVYGGSKTGMMGAVADGVHETGGSVIGIVPDVAEIQARTYPYLTELVRTHTMAERKSEMIKRAEAFIALPGGIGTLDEITEILSLYSLKIVTGPVIFYNMNGYYEPMKAVLQNILQNGYGREEYFRDVLFAEGLDEIKEAIEWRS